MTKGFLLVGIAKQLKIFSFAWDESLQPKMKYNLMVSTNLFWHWWRLLLQPLPASQRIVQGAPAESPPHGDRRKSCLLWSCSLLSTCLLLSSAPTVCAFSFTNVLCKISSACYSIFICDVKINLESLLSGALGSLSAFWCFPFPKNKGVSVWFLPGDYFRQADPRQFGQGLL